MGNKLADYQKAFDAAHSDAHWYGAGFLRVRGDGTVEHLNHADVIIQKPRCAECDCEKGGEDCNWIATPPDAGKEG
ncbi:hypothetical protein [Sulfitobacter pacificus]|uniref:hypothetical protein n=1 Tax=Sulfitobacter pacificus TaxID=1499314 RepID=UPI0031049DA5